MGLGTVTLTMEFTVDATVWQDSFTIDLSQFAGKTDAEVKTKMLNMLQDYVSRRIASASEIESGLWKRASQFIGKEFTLG